MDLTKTAYTVTYGTSCWCHFCNRPIMSGERYHIIKARRQRIPYRVCMECADTIVNRARLSDMEVQRG